MALLCHERRSESAAIEAACLPSARKPRDKFEAMRYTMMPRRVRQEQERGALRERAHTATSPCCPY